MSKVIATVLVAAGLLVAGIALGRMVAGGMSSPTPSPEVTQPAAAQPETAEPRRAEPERATPKPKPKPTRSTPLGATSPRGAKTTTGSGRMSREEYAATKDAAARKEAPTKEAAGGQLSGKRAAATTASARLEPPSIDLGFMEPGHLMTSTFKVRNYGDEPLVVQDIKADCRCTTLEKLDGTTIDPGGAIDVTARMKYEMATTGPRMSRVTVRFRGYEDPLEMRIAVELTRAVRVSPAYLPLARGQSGELELSSIDDKPFRVLSVHGETPQFVGFDPADPPATSYTVQWDLSRFDLKDCTDAEGNRLPVVLAIETDHPDAPIVDLLVRHACTRSGGRTAWRPGDAALIVGRVAAGEPLELTIEAKWLRSSGRTTDEIESVSSASDQLVLAELVDVERRGLLSLCKVRVIPAPGTNGLLYAPITLSSSRASNDVVIVGSVR